MSIARTIGVQKKERRYGHISTCLCATEWIQRYVTHRNAELRCVGRYIEKTFFRCVLPSPSTPSVNMYPNLDVHIYTYRIYIAMHRVSLYPCVSLSIECFLYVYMSTSVHLCISATQTLYLSVPIYFSICLSLCLLYTSPSPRDRQKSRMPSSA